MTCSAERNPFRVSQIESIRFRFHSGGMKDLLRRLTQISGRGMIVGPHGSGKSTLLRELFQYFSVRGWKTNLIQLSDQRKKLSEKEQREIRVSDIILLDGAEQLSLLRWKSFLWSLKYPQNLIATSHQEGRLPLLYHCKPQETLFQELARSLAPGTRIETELLEDVFSLHEGNMREAFFELYNHYSAENLNWIQSDSQRVCNGVIRRGSE